jgi:hypothetical protein
LTARDNPNGLRFCDATPDFRTTFKVSGAYQLPWEFQLSGTFMAIPGPSVSANYTVTAGNRRRPIVGTTSGHHDHAREPRRANTVFLDYRRDLDLRLAQLPFDRYRIQASPTCSTCSMPAPSFASTKPTAPIPPPTHG